MRRTVALFGGIALCGAVAALFLLKARLNLFEPAKEADPQGTATADSIQPDPNPTIAGQGRLSPISPKTPDGVKTRELFDRWLADEKDSRTTVTPVLTDALQRNPGGNDDFYARARSVLNDPSVSLETKLALIDLLSRAAVPAAVQLFAELFRQNMPEQLRHALTGALSQTGEYFWDPQLFSEVSPVLLDLWRQSSDLQLLEATAIGMAKVGGQPNLDALVAAVLRWGTTEAQVMKSGDPHALAAWAALHRLVNPDAIPYATALLAQQNGSEAQIAIGAEILLSVGTIDAAQALLAWAQRAGDSSAPFARAVFTRIQVRDSLLFLSNALDQNARFRSNAVRQAVVAALQRGNP